MKIGGKKLDSKPASEMIVFPRGEEQIALRANAVMDRVAFDKAVPSPKPPKKRVKNNQLVDDFDSPKFAIAIEQHGAKFVSWLVIQSLCGVNKETQEDEPIEWEKVDKADPNTWRLWDDELRESGFSEMERKRIHSLVMTVNSINEARLDEARASFLQPAAVEQDPSSFPNTEQVDTQPGELANDSESDLQESQPVGMNSTSL